MGGLLNSVSDFDIDLERCAEHSNCGAEYPKVVVLMSCNSCDQQLHRDESASNTPSAFQGDR
jgi:hypothetical protein